MIQLNGINNTYLINVQSIVYTQSPSRRDDKDYWLCVIVINLGPEHRIIEIKVKPEEWLKFTGLLKESLI